MPQIYEVTLEGRIRRQNALSQHVLQIAIKSLFNKLYRV